MIVAFVNLHAHSAYSLLDGFNMPEAIVNRAKELGQEAIALTDHGAVHGVIDFYKKCKEENIKPIIGCEMYLADDIDEKSKKRYHITILARNNEGLTNLYKLITISNKRGFYYKPRVDLDTIQEHSKGLIIMSGCLAGEIPQSIINNGNPFELAKKYNNMFDYFFLEIQPNKLEEQYVVNKKLVEVSNKLHIPLVATNDVHYINKEDAEYHDVMLAIQTKSNLDDEDRLSFDNNEFYLKSKEEVLNDLFDEEGYEYYADKAVANTGDIATLCDNIEIDLGGFHLPDYEIPENHNYKSYIKEKCLKRLSKMDVNHQRYEDRLDEELRIIDNKGFCPYFLIVADFMNWADNNDIMVGSGRGSAGGCLTSYLLGITNIDPIKHGLLFSRFLNEERDSNPDIDIDFAKKDRDRVIDYVRDKYGDNNVARICTFGTMSTKAVIKDVGRVLGYSFEYMNDKIGEAIPYKASSVHDARIKSKDLRNYAKKHPDIFKYAERLEGKPRHLGEHACAVVITPKPVVNYMPLARTSGDLVTQFEMENTEELGLLKMDFLGLKTLDIISDTISQIHKRHDIDRIEDKLGFLPTVDNIWDIPLDDYNVYKNIFQQADNNGVFQMESRLFKQLLEDMKPKNFENIVALLALGRPGTLDAEMDEVYINRMHGEEEVEYYHEDLEEVLEPTFGIILYQEQILKIAQIIAGYTLGEADILRRAVGKKKEKLMEEQKEKFVNGAIEQGYDKELGEYIFELIEYFANYGFNKSHSAAYAMISYVTAFLKYYFPSEFYASLMTQESGKTFSENNIKDYISDCYRRKIKVLPPDINKSDKSFKSIDGDILFGLSIIKGVGDKAVEEIINKRPYDDLYDFMSKIDSRVVNKTVVESLIKSGCFDFLEDNRNTLLSKYYNEKGNNSGTMSLFGSMREDISKDEIIDYEKEVLNISLTYPNRWLMMDEGDRIEVQGFIKKIKIIETKNGNEMAFVNLKNKIANIECVLFPRQYGRLKDYLVNDAEMIFEGVKQDSSLKVMDIRGV